MSSRVDLKLPFLEDNIIGVASVLLTYTGASGSSPVSGDCSAHRPNNNPDCGVQVVEWCEWEEQ